MPTVQHCEVTQITASFDHHKAALVSHYRSLYFLHTALLLLSDLFPGTGGAASLQQSWPQLILLAFKILQQPTSNCLNLFEHSDLNSVAVLFLILAFSSAIGAYGPNLYDFDSIPEGAAELRTAPCHAGQCQHSSQKIPNPIGKWGTPKWTVYKGKYH